MRTAVLLLLFVSYSAGGQIDQERWWRAEQEIRRFAPHKLLGLPPSVTRYLRRHGYRIPQAYDREGPHNAVRGRLTTTQRGIGRCSVRVEANRRFSSSGPDRRRGSQGLRVITTPATCKRSALTGLDTLAAFRWSGGSTFSTTIVRTADRDHRRFDTTRSTMPSRGKRRWCITSTEPSGIRSREPIDFTEAPNKRVSDAGADTCWLFI